MGFRDRLAWFCPYNTLKRESSASENSLVKHFRERKTFVYMVVALALIAPIAYGLLMNPQTRRARIHEEKFVAKVPGEFMINMLGASTTVNVIDHPGA